MFSNILLRASLPISKLKLSLPLQMHVVVEHFVLSFHINSVKMYGL
jgi:hypothetical protein